MATCPNKNLQDWKLLVASRGEDVAYYLWDTYEGNVPESESKSEIVKSGLKATNILQSPKADQFFNAVAKNKITGDFFWKKMQADLGIPKDQIEILKSFDTQDREELISSLLANYSYAVEINTGKSVSPTIEFISDAGTDGKGLYTVVDPQDYGPVASFKTKEEAEQFIRKELSSGSSNFYSNLTVPGGTNYTENEIATPAITPSIKGHAQFATDQGIGWFRSDDKQDSVLQWGVYTPENELLATFKTEQEAKEFNNKRKDKDWNQVAYVDTNVKETKTRRILELQSDLFQKGRDKKMLPTLELQDEKQKAVYDKLKYSGFSVDQKFKVRDTWFVVTNVPEKNKYTVRNLSNNKTSTISRANLIKSMEQYNVSDENIKRNEFLQLLNKDSNWVTFFVKSIIQDSAKKGYEKVVFPTGSTVYKIESGGNSLEDFINNKETRIKELENSLFYVKVYEDTVDKKGNYVNKQRAFNFKTEEEAYQFAEENEEKLNIGEVEENIQNKNEIARLKKEVKDAKAGVSGLPATAKFYEENVANVLKKQGYTPKQVTDEYGNTWNEVEIVPEREQQTILFQKQTEELPSSRASEETLNKVKALIAKMGVKIQDLQDYLKGNPDVDTTDVNGLADLVRGIIAIAEGKEDVALTEEMVHIATAIIEKVDPKFVTEMISKIDRFAIYKKVFNAYKDDKNYQLPNGKPDIRKIKKEAVDKLIVELIINKSEGSVEFPELMEELPRTMVQKIWNAILDFFSGRYRKANIDIFTEATERVLQGDLGARYYNEVKPGVETLFDSNPELANIGTAEQYSAYLDSIFPDSQVKDIVYHGTNEKFDTFDFTREKTDPFTKDGAYFATIPYGYKEKLPALLDIKNPKEFADITDTSNKFGELEKSTEFDSAIGKSTSKGYENYREYVVFEPEQIHILGNEQDIEGFKSFMQTAPAEFQGEGVFFKKGSSKISDKQKELQELILDTKDRIKKRESKEKVDPLLADSEEASNYYVELETNGNERKITKRVTDRVKAWYEQRFGKNKKFTKEEEFINDFKREHGVQYHFYFEDIHNRYFKEDGTRRETPLSRTVDVAGPNEEIYERLEQYYVDLVKKFSEGKKNPLVFSEVVVYDPKEQEAGTIDLLIIEENGKANIFDWKFMTVSATAEDVAWYKQGAYNIQLGRYKDILRDSYGVKEFGQMRAIPILMDVKRKNWRNPDSDLVVKGIEIGSVNVSKIKDFTLVPVSEETESTGNEELDEAITQLNAVLKQVGKEGVTNEDEKRFKGERMNALSKAIRAAQSANNLVPLIQVIKLMRKEGQNLINDWETIYNKKAASADDINDAQLSEYADSLREYIAISQVFGSMNDLIGNLIYDKSEIKNAKTDKQKEDLARRKAYLENIDNEAKLIRLSSKKVENITKKFADKFMGERNLVQGLLSPQAVWSGIGSFFRGASEVPLPSVSILFKLVTNAKGRARRDALKEVEELMAIRKRITDKGGDVRKYIQQLYQKDDKNKLVNKIIYKYKKEFTDLVDKNAAEEFPSKEWLYNNIDREGYQKEANEVLEKRIERLKRIYSEDKEMMNKLILQEKRMFDVTRNDFTGWNNYIIKRNPARSIDKNGIETSPWLSDEYKNIQNDKELLDLYNFLIKTNKKASDVGYLENKVHSTFLPFVRKSMAESLAWDFSLSSIMNFGNGLSLQADDIGFGNVNELTGEIEHSIPKYYTSDFSMKQDEAGNTIHDYTDVSEDLFKNMILYINHMHNYKYLSEVEGQAQLIKTVESFKKHLATTRSGDVIIKPNGEPEKLEGNEQNTKIFDDFLRALLYEQKYPMSDTDTSIETGLVKQMKKLINGVSKAAGGKEVFTDLDKPSATSLFKSMDSLNRAFQLKTLGLDIVSGAVNLFGANIQVITQAGNYFTKWDYFKNFNGLIGSRFKNDDDRKMFLKLIDTFMPLKDDPTYDKLKEAGLSKITRQNFSDWLMLFMREPEQHVEKSIFLTLLDNSMIVDGKIVNIREFVKSKYKDRWDSASDYAGSSKKIEDEIKELKSTSSITNTMKLENDELVIPGLDLTNFKEIDRVTKLSRRISRNAVGGMSDSDINRMSMSVWGRSMMVFKNWIPKLLDTRFGELRKISDDFSVTIDENGLTEGEKYDIGRVRLWWGVLASSINDKSFNVLNILQVNDKGLLLLDKMYIDYKASYEKRTGEKFNMTKEDFNEMIRTNLRNQVQELTMLLVLFGLKLSMGMLPPDDDEDRASKNFFRYSQRVVDKFVGELSFFYNPLEAEHLLSGSMFPAIGVFSDVIKFTSHFSSQVLGFEISDPTLSEEDVRKKAQPVKYLAKMLPVTKSLLTYGAIFNDDFAKEFDITIQKNNNR